MKYMLTGGGSGGHIYPLLSFANVVRELDPAAEFLFVGKKNNMEAEIVPKAGLSFTPIATTGTKGTLSWQNVKAAGLITLGYLQAKKIIRDFAPDVCLGGGGYVSVPLMLATTNSSAKIVTAVLESDQFMGRANLQLAKNSDLVFGGLFDLKDRYFAGVDNYYHVGHPRMQELYEKYQTEIDAKLNSMTRKHILFIGGSLGAATINEQALVFAAYLARKERADINITLITGKRYYDDFKIYEKQFPFITIIAYSDAIGEQYLLADLLICRASAGVLAEATTFNLPFIAMPSPNVMRNHQCYNAEYFVERGAGRMFAEEDIAGDNFAAFIYDTFESQTPLEHMKQELTKIMHKDAVSRMYALIQEAKEQKLLNA